MQFKISTNRTFKNKVTGRDNGRLNAGFRTETVTPDEFLNVIALGHPYTAVLNPNGPGAASRGRKTQKVTENYLSRQELTTDDDSQAPGVVSGWLRNEN